MTILYAVNGIEGVRLELRHETDADGVVAAVYADVRRRMAFVPALFKALAPDVHTLERAWVQARALLDDHGFPEAAARLRALAQPEETPAARADLQDAVGPFAAELPGMLLVVSSLGLALDGRLSREEPPPLGLEPGDRRPPDGTVPEEHREHPIYADVRAVYGTMHVPTLYRSLAARGLLDEAWRTMAPALTSPAGRARVEQLARAGEEEALRFPGIGWFDCESARPVLAQFRRALPRNLVAVFAVRPA
jgi:hypothetical protein